LIAIAMLTASAIVVVACDDEAGEPETPTGDEPAATATVDDEEPEATATEASPGETPKSPDDGGPDAPSDVSLSGPLPDLDTPVPPGGGEQGRLTIEWTDNSVDEDGFRVYQECGGEESVLLEVAADETSYGPFQTCRPGRVGVAAYNAEGESEIAWAP
jgi:hypothetical protein